MDELLLGLDGALNMSEKMEALSRGIATNSVPSLWMAQMSTRVQVCVCCVTCVPCVCCVTRVQVCVLRRMCTVCLYVYPLPSLWMAQMSTRVRGRACALLTNEHDVCVNVNHGQRV